MTEFKTRQAFLESHGATCKNWRWSWSWVNHKTKVVIFGASTEHEVGTSQKILDPSWQRNRDGRKSPAYTEALENLVLVTERDYELVTFRQFEEPFNEKTGRVIISQFFQELEARMLVVKGDGWYAVPADDFSDSSSHNGHLEEIYIEGTRKTVLSTKVERSSFARNACIEKQGTTCVICEFDFEKVYGELGAGFIHVHHLNPVSDSRDEYTLNPDTDLRPVCPNCHAMIHRGGKTRSIAEIKSLLER